MTKGLMWFEFFDYYGSLYGPNSGLTRSVCCLRFGNTVCSAPLHAKLLQSCPALCDPVDCSPPSSSIHGILHHFHALEKEMATHSSIFAWRISWMEELGGLQSMESQRVRHD